MHYFKLLALVRGAVCITWRTAVITTNTCTTITTTTTTTTTTIATINNNNSYYYNMNNNLMISFKYLFINSPIRGLIPT